MALSLKVGKRLYEFEVSVRILKLNEFLGDELMNDNPTARLEVLRTSAAYCSGFRQNAADK